ncbi:hypothetical protein ACFT4A_31465 [Streptomyces sp. NPDC057099]|uniref:hypothetical protein n=1 Tax=Streptomyces sp. NPDC057099 TaxID=3346019 RepID=UPI003644A82D
MLQTRKFTKTNIRRVGAVSAVLVVALASGTEAQAATGHGKKYGSCQNSVKIWRTGSKIYAQGKMVCNTVHFVLRPDAGISAYKNGKFKEVKIGGAKGCPAVKKCTSKKVSLKAHKGWDYRAANSGTADADNAWPKNTQAVAWYKYR